MASFIYNRLTSTDSIRLLSIRPRPSEDENDIPVQCSLQEVRLCEKPSYNALSYTWGNPRSITPYSLCAPYILCNEGILPVTPNLHDALLQLRNSHAGDLVWIDAICIDQSFTPERNAQVNMMQDIYSSARNVIVWLGPVNDSGTQKVIQIIKMLPPLNEIDISFKSLETVNRVSKVAGRLSDWLHIAEFLLLNWFSRTWIIQEVVLAKQVVVLCGEEQIEWSALNVLVKAAAEFCRRYTTSGAIRQIEALFGSLSHLDSIGLVFQARNLLGEKRWDLGTWLQLSRTYQATDPRDKVFALLGVIGGPESRGMPDITSPATPTRWEQALCADYNKSTADVYREINKGLVIMQGGVSLLSMVGERTGLDRHGLPSWMPSYNTPLLPSPLMPIFQDQDKTFDAGTIISHVTQVLVDNDVLILRAILWDVVEDVGEYCWELEVLERITKMLQIATAAGLKYPNGQTTIEALSRTLTAGSIKDQEVLESSFRHWLIAQSLKAQETARAADDGGYSDDIVRPLRSNTSGEWSNAQKSAPELYRSETFGRALHEFSRVHQATLPLDTLMEEYRRKLETKSIKNPSEDSVVFRVGLSNICSARRVFRSRKNYLGVAPRSIRSGDVICIVAGARVPYILRPFGEENVLVGETYVHGIMHGEAIDQNTTFEDIRLI